MTCRMSAACIAAAALGAASCARTQASRAPADPPTVAVAAVARGDIAQVLRIAAEFRPFQEIDLHAKVAGYLKTIAVDVGDRVRAGQLVAVLEVPELQDDLRQDAASVRRAAEELNRAQADERRAESLHEVAHLGSTRLAGVMRARANLVAQQDLDEAAARDRAAEAQVATATAAIAAAQGQLEIAKANQNKTETLASYTRIVAPFGGLVTRRYADTGAMIQAGTSSQTQTLPLVRLSQDDTLRLVMPVPESAVSRIHVGAPVQLAVDSLGRTFRGAVARIAGRLDTDTRTMHVEVDVPNADHALVPGMYATASLALAEATHVLIAPVQAVDRADGGAGVVVVDRDGRVERRAVRVGLEAADRIEIVDGVAEGDLVVVGRHGDLKSGTRVSVKAVGVPAAAAGDR